MAKRKIKTSKTDFMSLLLIGFGVTILFLGFIPAIKFVGSDSLLGQQTEYKSFYNAIRLIFNGTVKTPEVWVLLITSILIILTALTSAVIGSLSLAEFIKVKVELICYILVLVVLALLILFVCCFFNLATSNPLILLESFGLSWSSHVFSDFVITTYVYFLFFVDLITLTLLFLSKDEFLN